jgi:hypothetical protein
MCFDCLSASSERGVHVPTQESANTQPSRRSSGSIDLSKATVVQKVGWLIKRERKKFLVVSSERVFCLLKGGVIFYFRAQKIDPKNYETGMTLPPASFPLALPAPQVLIDPDYIGQTDLAGATCKMTIEATHRFGIEIVCQGSGAGGSSGGQVIQFNAESHADQKHWLTDLFLICLSH